MQFTLEQLKKIMPNADTMRIDTALPYLNKTLIHFQINTPLRAASFIAQLAHESMELRYYEEIASGKAYEGRRDLGNTQPGDGVRFKGRGVVQLTGRDNYKKFGDYVGYDFIAHPEDLEKPEWGYLAAGWFWHIKCQPSLNSYADIRRFRQITKRINGGTNGWESRKAFYYRACSVLGIDEQSCKILD